MSVESEKDVAKKRNKGDTVRDGVMRGKDEGTARLLMEQGSAKKWSLVRSKGRVYRKRVVFPTGAISGKGRL